MYHAVSNNNPFSAPLYSLQTWLENIEIQAEKLARRIVKLIPSQCPFARKIRLFNQVILCIPSPVQTQSML